MYTKSALTRCHTSSFVGKTSVLRDSWSEYGHVTHGDVKLKVIAAEAGDSVVLGEVMSHYTSHAGGSWQSLEASAQAPLKLRSYQVILPRAELTRKELSRVAANQGRAYLKRLYRDGNRKEAFRQSFQWLKVVRTVESRAILLRPPISARISQMARQFWSIFSRRHR